MVGWPVLLNVANRRIVVVGGGPVAARRVRTLLQAGATKDDITVVAPAVCDELAASGVRLQKAPYHTGDCEDAFLVIIATDDEALNDAVASEAAETGALVNRADKPDAGDLAVMAHRRNGPLTIAAATDGTSAAAARRIVESLAGAVDGDWIVLLRIAGEFRPLIQQRLPDATARQAALQRLTDDEAMTALKQYGIKGLRQHLQRLMDDTHAA